MRPTFSEWVKRLGQQHWSLSGQKRSETLCGKAMLGNNYASVLLENDKVPCEECAGKKETLEDEYNEQWEDAMYKKLVQHVGHDVELVHYGDESNPANMSVECLVCNTVLFSFDKPADDEV